MEQFHPRHYFLLQPSSLLPRRRHSRSLNALARQLMLGIVFGEATAALLLPIPCRLCQELLAFYGICRQKREPTSGLEPLNPAHYECAVNGCWALHKTADPA
jgi:hypothetical protein